MTTYIDLPPSGGSAAVTSVNGQIGTVVLSTDNIPEGLTNLYYTDTRARAAISATAPLSYNSTTGVLSLAATSTVVASTVAANTTTGVGATGVYGNVTSISLTAGSWFISGTAGFNENGATLTTGLQCGISTSASGAGINEFDTSLSPYLISSTSDALIATPTVLVTIGSTTTFYLNTKFSYTAGTPRHRGRIQAVPRDV